MPALKKPAFFFDQPNAQVFLAWSVWRIAYWELGIWGFEGVFARSFAQVGGEKVVFFCQNQSFAHGKLYLFVKKGDFFVFICIFFTGLARLMRDRVKREF